MELALSVTGTLATLISIGIALLAFTADARLHRRITKLQAANDLMADAPSPALNRALRFTLADLQARELLRHQLQTSRLTAVLFTSMTIFLTLFLAVLSVGPTLIPLIERDWVVTIGWSAMWVTFIPMTCLLVMRHCVYGLRRTDYMAALFKGITPPKSQLGQGAVHVRNHPHWKRALVTSLLNTIACVALGLALSALTFALLSPQLAAIYFASTGLFGAISLGFAAFGIASAMGTERGNLWPHPSRMDFGATH